MDDIEQLTRGLLLENMLSTMVKASLPQYEQALHVLRTDSEIDRLRNLL